MQRVKSDFLQRPTFATSNERVLQRVTSDFYFALESKWLPPLKFISSTNIIHMTLTKFWGCR